MSRLGSREPDYADTLDALPTAASKVGQQLTKAAERLLATGTFTFMPDQKNRFGWLVRYPDGRAFKLGDEFISECPVVVGRATNPATIRFELDEQRACNSGRRTPIQVDGESLKDVNADGSPDVVAEIVTGGNVNGHITSLISLTPTGPKAVRRAN